MKKIFLESFSHLIDTPQVIVFRSVLEENIMRMGEVARSNDLLLRPHIKTHKTPQLARLQNELCGDVFRGITSSKVEEALVFADHGFDDILLAFPVTSQFKAQKFLQQIKKIDGRASVLVDSFHSYRVWNEVSDHLAFPVDIFAKIDVGLHRCGFDPDNEVGPLLELVKEITSSNPYCRFTGLLSHAGQSYGKDTREEVQAVCIEEQDIMKNLKEIILDEFEHVVDEVEVSVGSTPTCLACTDYYPDLVTEIRPGNYVFCDRTPLRLGLIEEDGISMNILAEVVSENEWYYILDCGSKTLSSDRGAQGSEGSQGYGLVYGTSLFLEKLSEEHGWVKKGTGEENVLEIGDKVLVIPNHACAVSNLGDDLLIFDEKNESNPYELWTVEARGKRK